MLFNGWSVAAAKGAWSANNPWRGHPLNGANNINGVDGDPNGDGSGEDVHELGNPAALAVQEAYVRKVVDTLNDLDNVLYEISNESHADATEWQYHMVSLIKTYEDGMPNRHPVGMTSAYPDGDNSELFRSPADWISPNEYGDSPSARGVKVILSDTDHIWGIGGDRGWVWESFTRGLNPTFMDGYDGAGSAVGTGTFELADPRWVSLRRNLGYARLYAERMDLARTEPDSLTCSTGYCLVSTGASSAEYLVYAPTGGALEIDLSRTGDAWLSVEWLNPADGSIHREDPVRGGSATRFITPFGGDAVLYLREEPAGGSAAR
jgi:hypothetical protein